MLVSFAIKEIGNQILTELDLLMAVLFGHKKMKYGIWKIQFMGQLNIYKEKYVSHEN